MKLTIILLLASLAIMAQAATRTATLTWTDDKNPSGTMYNVYRASGVCAPTGLTFAKVNTTPVNAKTYSDAGLVTGAYCYVVTATLNNVESDYSNQADALAKPFTVNINVITTQ